MKCHDLFCIYTFYYFNYLPLYLATDSEECYNGKIRTAGTGTVLFYPTDVYKTCWSQEEIAILTARLILEDVIPDPKMISIQCNEDVEDLIEYFKVVIETIRANTKARKRHIMLLALTDLLGGYLHHVVLPMARKAYYAGAVDYSYMEKLIQLYEELKWFLRTNGQGWSKPMIINKEVRVSPIEVDKYEVKKLNDSCCHRLLFYEHEPLKTRKRSVASEKGIFFPLPFFDAKYRPTSIVVPLKRFALRNIESKRSAYILMKYFISAEQCLKEKHPKRELVQKFRNNLLTWIEKEVVSKLNDDKFYSAFGGVLRVRSTLKSLGAKVGPVTCNSDEGEEEVGAIPAVGCTSKRNKLILIAMLVVIIAWFFIGTCFICYRMRNSKNSKTADKSDPKNITKHESSTSFSSSKWSSIWSRSSSKSSKSQKQLCKCCESTISEKSTTGYTSTSEYESERRRKKDKRKKTFGPSSRKTSYSSPCVCPKDEPAIIDTKHSMKVLPSIAEMSENSLSKDKNGSSMRKISFANQSGVSSSDGGSLPCAPPWAQTRNTVPCPILSNKSTNYSTSRSSTNNSRDAHDITDVPIASSTKYEQNHLNQTSINGPNRVETSATSYEEQPASSIRNNTISAGSPSQFRQSYLNDESSRTNHLESIHELDPPLASSSLRYDETEMTNGYQTSNTPGEESLKNGSNKSLTRQISNTGTVEEYPYMENEEVPPKIKKEIQNEQEEKSYYDYHMACHSSMSGNYDLFHKQDPNKPYVFGYDFQTSTSSDLSDDDFKY